MILINFVSGSAQRTLRLMTAAGVGHCAGAMTSPSARNHPSNAVALGLPWCIDNDCFTGYDPSAIIRALDNYRDVPGCVFATVPDVVGNHAATLTRFRAWIGTYQQFGYPAAFVLQNGIGGPADVPWDDIAAVFIGGDDAFKFSDVVRFIVAEAKRRDKWVHMGRVNTLRRIRYATSIHCDSTDGTGFTFDEKFRFASAFHHAQLGLFEVGAQP